MEIKELINSVVTARAVATQATLNRSTALAAWQEQNKDLYAAEKEARDVCAEAETALREKAIEIYGATQEKQADPTRIPS